MHCRWCHNPEGISPEPEILFREERCNDCGACIDVCTKGAIQIRKDTKVVLAEDCDLCGECVTACVVGAWEIVGRRMTVDDILETVEKDTIFYDESGGGITFSGGEPLTQIEFLRSCLMACRERSISTVVDTSGYCTSDMLEEIEKYVQLFLYDLKTVDDDIHRSYMGVSNRVILENLKALDSRGRSLIVRIPIIPGVNDDEAQIDGSLELLESLSSLQEVHLLPYHRLGVSKAKRLRTKQRSIASYCFEPERFDTIYQRFVREGFTVKTGG